MSLDSYPRGVLVPALTPFRPDLTVDDERFVDHCRWLLAEGANGLAVFGTTSEANSLSVAERMSLLVTLDDPAAATNAILTAASEAPPSDHVPGKSALRAAFRGVR